MTPAGDEGGDVAWAVGWPWRVGRKVGRTIYAVTGSDPSDADVLIGMMDSRKLAAEAVGAHNDRLRDRLGRGAS